MMRYDEILGQRSSIELLQQMLRRGRIPHALLFQGPEGVGKASVAGIFGAALLCRSAEVEACGGCEDCRLLGSGNHPDFLGVTRLPKKSAAATARGEVAPGPLRQVIGVDQVRELSHLATLAPRRAARRVFLVDEAERMTLEAQNALLKTLEEPPGRAQILLVSSRPHMLLPTVRSRCFALRFAAMRPAELAELLTRRGLEREESLTRAALAEGRPGRALVLDVEDHRQRRDELIATLERLSAPSPDLTELAVLAAGLAGKTEETLAEGLELLQSLLRDAARAGMRQSDPALVHVDVGGRLAAIGGRLGTQRAVALMQAAERLRSQLRLNLNRTLVAESLLAAVAGGPLPERGQV